MPVLLVDAVFLVFLAAQATANFGGHEYLERITGLTYAEYVHQGFGQLTVATALTLGCVRLADFEPDRLSYPATLRVMQRIRTSVDPELEAAFPAKRAARVAIRAKGKREEWLQPTRIGDPDAPLSDKMLEDKYFELVTPVLGAAKAREVLARLWNLE